eukprot:3046444-Rhodomonas_salina.1
MAPGTRDHRFLSGWYLARYQKPRQRGPSALAKPPRATAACSGSPARAAHVTPHVISAPHLAALRSASIRYTPKSKTRNRNFSTICTRNAVSCF